MPIQGVIEAPGRAKGTRVSARLRMNLGVAGSLDAGEQAPVLVHNLSASGMLIEARWPLSIGQKILVSLPEAGDVSASVVWRSENLAGCQFERPLSRAALSAARLRNPAPEDDRRLDPPVELPVPDALAARLLRLRRERGLSRAALAELIGLSAPSIWAWETARTTPRRNSLRALAAAFGISESELIGSIGGAKGGGESASRALHHVIDASKERIAEVAGVNPRQVRIVIEI